MTMTLTAGRSDVSTDRRSRSLLRTGVTSGAVAAAATTAVAAVAHTLGVSFESAPGDAIPLLGFAQLTFVFTMVGVLIARTLRRHARRPRATDTRIGGTTP